MAMAQRDGPCMGGAHICHVADGGRSSTRFLEDFTRRGLRRGERTVWVVDGGVLRTLADRQVRGGDGAAHPLPEVRTLDEVYLDAGRFDVDAMLARYEAELRATLDAGYPGLRVVADASGLGRDAGAQDAFIEYERRVNALFATYPFSAVCCYDPARVPADWLAAVAAEHPLTGRAGTLAAGACAATARTDGVRLAGDVDITNAGTLQAMLAELAPAQGDVHLYAAQLVFVDVAGARALLDLARRLDGGRRLVVHAPPPSLRTVLELGWPRLPDPVVLCDG